MPEDLLHLSEKFKILCKVIFKFSQKFIKSISKYVASTICFKFLEGCHSKDGKKIAVLNCQKVVEKVDKSNAILGFWRHTGIFDNTYEYHHLKVSQPCMTTIWKLKILGSAGMSHTGTKVPLCNSMLLHRYAGWDIPMTWLHTFDESKAKPEGGSPLRSSLLLQRTFFKKTISFSHSNWTEMCVQRMAGCFIICCAIFLLYYTFRPVDLSAK